MKNSDPKMNFLESFQAQQAEEEERFARLRSQKKSLAELVLEGRFNVTGVEVAFSRTSSISQSETLIGGPVVSDDSGYTALSILNVLPEVYFEVPIRKLIFYGNSSVRAGDFVLAKIPCYQEIRSPISFPEFAKETFYIPRKFKRDEEAIKLSIISSDKRVLREELSANYPKYQK